MMACPEENGLIFKPHAGLAVLKDFRRNETSLICLIADCDQARLFSRFSIGPKIFGEALAREIDNTIGGREDRLRRSVITIERNDFRSRRERVRELKDVANCRGAE